MHRSCGADCCWRHLYLDLTPLGRQEDGEHPQEWIRHHDKYGVKGGSAAIEWGTVRLTNA